MSVKIKMLFSLCCLPRRKMIRYEKKIMEGDFGNEFLVWEIVYDMAVRMLLLQNLLGLVLGEQVWARRTICEALLHPVPLKLFKLSETAVRLLMNQRTNEKGEC